MLLPTDEDRAAERAALREAIDHSDDEFRRAVAGLKAAVRGRIGLVHRLAENVAAEPLPWLFASALVGVWLGRRSDGGDGEENGDEDD